MSKCTLANTVLGLLYIFSSDASVLAQKENINITHPNIPGIEYNAKSPFQRIDDHIFIDNTNTLRSWSFVKEAIIKAVGPYEGVVRLMEVRNFSDLDPDKINNSIPSVWVVSIIIENNEMITAYGFYVDPSTYRIIDEKSIQISMNEFKPLINLAWSHVVNATLDSQIWFEAQGMNCRLYLGVRNRYDNHGYGNLNVVLCNNPHTQNNGIEALEVSRILDKLFRESERGEESAEGVSQPFLKRRGVSQPRAVARIGYISSFFLTGSQRRTGRID